MFESSYLMLIYFVNKNKKIKGRKRVRFLPPLQKTSIGSQTDSQAETVVVNSLN
jgi:hypothetical protein